LKFIGYINSQNDSTSNIRIIDEIQTEIAQDSNEYKINFYNETNQNLLSEFSAIEV
jgi:hypothetical protein